MVMFSFKDFNTLMEVSKEGRVFPVAKQFFGELALPLNPSYLVDDRTEQSGMVELIISSATYQDNFVWAYNLY